MASFVEKKVGIGEVAPGGLVLGYFDAAYIDHSIDLRWLMLSSAKVRSLVSRF